MSTKLNFARTINSLGGMPPMSDCYNYGMTYGCDKHCPVLQAGNCELKDAECKDLYADAISLLKGENVN